MGISKCEMKISIALYFITVFAIQKSHQKPYTYSECPCDSLGIPKDNQDDYSCLRIKYKDGNVIKSTWDCINTTRTMLYCNQYKFQYIDLIDCSVLPSSAEKTNTNSSSIKKAPSVHPRVDRPDEYILTNDIFDTGSNEGALIAADTPDKIPNRHVQISHTFDTGSNDDSLTVNGFDDDSLEDVDSSTTDAPDTKPTPPSPTTKPTKKPRPTRRPNDSSTIKLNILLLVISFISTYVFCIENIVNL